MSQTSESVTASTVSSLTGTEREIMVLERDDAVEIIERLRETHHDRRGRAFLLNITPLILRMGARWDAKRELVFEHLKTGFERRFPEPNWCIAISENTWLAVLPTEASRKGAMSVVDMWLDLGNFFVGDLSGTDVPLYAVEAYDVDKFAIARVRMNSFFERDEEEAHSVRARPGAMPEAAEKRPEASPQMSAIQRPVIVAQSVAYAGRTVRVASSAEPLFEMRKMVMIGHRLEAMVIEGGENTLLDRKGLANMDWNLREQVDVANIEQGIKLIRLKEPDARKMLMVVPAAFSTFASNRARARITQEVSRAATDMQLKVLFEVRGLDGVPPHRILEIVSMIKPFCMTVVGSVSADRKSIATLHKCGLSGVCVEYDGVKREDAALNEYLSVLSAAAKASAGACMVQGFDNYRQMAVARMAGVTHASIKATAMMTAKVSDQPTATA
jgi:hypothetical protein